MLTLFSYPGLFGLADNNPYGLKVFAFLKLAGLAFTHVHVVETADAPRGQLPYLRDDDECIGDSDAIIAHLIARYAPSMDAGLTTAQRDTDILVRRMLDDLYWVMSTSRWKDPRFWPLFRDALLRGHASLTEAMLNAAREHNSRRYHYQGIGRYEPAAAYARGIADLQVLANLVPESGFVFGDTPCSVDAAVYGFVANILFYDIPTPLKEYLLSKPNLVAHCQSIHAALLV